jgi:hypothetical protein
MSLLERVRGWLQDRRRREDEELAAEVRGEVHDLKSHKAGVRDQKSSEDFPSGSSGVGLIP